MAVDKDEERAPWRRFGCIGSFACFGMRRFSASDGPSIAAKNGISMKQALILFVLLTAGCYDPTFPQGIQCSSEGQCPRGQVCAFDGRCYDEDMVPQRGDNTLAALEVSRGELVPGFDPEVTSYQLDLPLAAEDLVVTPTAAKPDGVTLNVAGSEVASGEASPAVALALGGTLVEVTVTPDFGDPRTYTIRASRGAGILQEAYLKASNSGFRDNFGGTVIALEKDTLAVGASEENSNATGVGGNQADDSLDGAGAAYVLVKTDTGWVQQAYIKASNTGLGDFFGLSVAISGDTLAVGAPGESSDATSVDGDQTNDNATNSGAVYIFVRNGTTWSQQAYIKASDAVSGDFFGNDVALDGDTLAVGAPLEDSSATGINGDPSAPGANSSGAVYVFTRSGSQWSQRAYIKASNTGAGDNFGRSVALSGETLAVGAPLEDSSARGVNRNQTDEGADAAGAVYVFTGSGSDWSQQAYLKASNTDAGDHFGGSIALDGDSLVVGASGEASGDTGPGGNQDDNSAADAGAVYVFQRSGTEWSQQAYLKASNTDGGDSFGEGQGSVATVAIEGDALVVGAIGEASDATGVGADQTSNAAAGAGAAYLFTRSGSEWSQQAYIKASNTGAGDAFGWAVAISGGVMAIGARREDSGADGVNGGVAAENDNSTEDAGAVYIFE